jgi:ABC-2 type transport system permease protein
MWRQLWTMTASDLRQRVRDRSVLIFSLVVPLALMSVMNLTMGDAGEPELKPVTVAASVPEGDRLGEALVGALSSTGVVEVTVEAVAPDEVQELARDGHAALGVVVPEGFTADVQRGAVATVDLVERDFAGLETDVLLSVVRAVLDQLAVGAHTAAAAARAGVPHDELAALAERAATQAPAVNLSQGETASEQLSVSGALVAGQAGLFLLFTVGFGVLALVTEREQGTLARLRSMPMPPGLVVVAKALVGYILGVVATTVLLTAGSVLFDVSFGSPVVVAVLVLCAVAAATSLMFIIARVARTAEQAGIAQSILAIVLGMAGGAFFPIAGTGLAGRLLDLNPVAAFTRGLGISSGGGGLSDIGVPVAILLGFAVVAVGVSRLVPDRGREL